MSAGLCTTCAGAQPVGGSDNGWNFSHGACASTRCCRRRRQSRCRSDKAAMSCTRGASRYGTRNTHPDQSHVLTRQPEGGRHALSTLSSRDDQHQQSGHRGRQGSHDDHPMALPALPRNRGGNLDECRLSRSRPDPYPVCSRAASQAPDASGGERPLCLCGRFVTAPEPIGRNMRWRRPDSASS